MNCKLVSRMQIWLDTIDCEAIADGVKTGVISGVTTNPSILSKANNVRETLSKILNIQPGPVAVQVVANDPEGMIKEGQSYYEYSPRIIVKVPVTRSGLIAIKSLRGQGIPVMATMVLFPTQVLLAANHEATYVAPYFSHMSNHGDAFETLKLMVDILRANQSETRLLVASLKELDQIVYCATLGVEAVTIKAELYYQLVADHPAVAVIAQKFESDWRIDALDAKSAID